MPPPASLSSRYKRSKRAAKIAEGEELVALTSGGQKQLLLWSKARGEGGRGKVGLQPLVFSLMGLKT